MPNNEIIERWYIYKVPVKSKNELKAYAAEREIDIGEAFSEAVAALRTLEWQKKCRGEEWLKKMNGMTEQERQEMFYGRWECSEEKKEG